MLCTMFKSRQGARVQRNLTEVGKFKWSKKVPSNKIAIGLFIVYFLSKGYQTEKMIY